MKQLQRIRPHAYLLIPGLLAVFFLAGASLPSSGKTAAYPNAHHQTFIPGTYKVTTTFQTGQIHRGTLTFNSDGTMSSNYPDAGVIGQGHGYWWVVNGQVNYTFRELLDPTNPHNPPGATDVQIVHFITNFQNDGKSFTSQGHGSVYSHGTSLFTVQTTNQGTFQ